MAEFKLGRIRFVWQGDWGTGTTYYKDDVVRLGGKTFICVVGHTAASDFYTDLDNVPTRWEQMTDGQEWRGDWTTDTFYSIGDVVKYGGLLYIANDSHTSAATAALGLEANTSDWDLYAEGFDWKGDWTVSTRYKKNDLAKYGGYTYVCNTHHTSAATVALGLEANSGSWDIFNQGIEYKTDWVAATRYKLNDVVKYGANLWICTTQHTASSAFGTDASTKWSLFVDGIQFEDEWDSGTTYQPGDIVVYGGNQYIAKTIHSNSSPGAGDSSVNWTLFVEGFKFQSDWNSAITYKVGEVVRVRGYTYLCLTENTNQEPPNGSYWEKLTSGIQWQGEWVDDVYYKLGDAVRYGTNAYICVLAHRSEGDDGSTIGPQGGGASNSRPDQDAFGTYWNLLSSGNETSVLTTRGDLVYFGGAGPTRLPVGIEGQVLRAGTQDPEWTSWGQVDHVYYVAPHGVDGTAPINGITLDKPWKSIRYACEQVEKGCRNPNTQRLLEMNRAFIQREVTKWIEYQISTVGGVWAGFDYDEYKCERDVGFIVDRLIWDLGHGGNLKIRAAAQTYVNALGEGPYSTEESGTGIYTKISTEAGKDVLAFNYMLDVIESVLNNEAPAVNYQALTGDSSTAVADQFIDTTIPAEVGVMTTITSLVGIINTALTDGDTTNLPAREVPSNVIMVKAGTYRETLPIIVPAETCILGDEVRAVHAGPADSLIDISDAQYSVASLGRLEEIVSDIILGNAVTVTTGNTATQDINWPYASSVEETSASQLVRVMQYNIDFRLGTTHMISNTDPTDYNTAYLSTYGNARTLIQANKTFFKEEIRAWITANYPNLKYSRTACLRDVGYIVDAFVYDLTYGGNSQAVQAGLAYYQGVGSSLYIDSTEKTATLGAYARLKSLFQSVAVDTLATPLQTTVAQVRGTAGSGATATFVGANMDTMIAIVTDGPGATYTLTDPSTSWVASALTTAYSTLNSAGATIAADTITYINDTYPTLVYNETKCSRDVGIILKAVGYDFMFNANFQTIKAAYSYLRATATEVFSLGQKTATRAALEYVRTQAIANVGANATAIARINASMQIIDDIIYSGSNEGSVCQTELRSADYAALQLERNRDFIVAEMSAWMNYNYVNFDDYYSSTTCARDIGYIVDAVVSDLATGSNFASSVAGESYYRIQAALVPDAQLMQTVAAVKEAKRISSGYVTDSSLYTAVNAAFDNVIAILQGGLTAVPTYTWPDNGTSDGTTVADAAALQTNRATMITGIETYLSTTAPYDTVWSGLTLAQKNACKRDVGYMIDAVTYDLQYGGTYQSTVAGSAYYSFGTLEIATGEKAATLAAITQLATLMQGYTSAGGDASVSTLTGVIYGIINTGATEPMTYTLPSVSGESAAKQATHASLKTTNIAAIKSGVTNYITTTFSSYTYSVATCERDVGTYIDALKFDLKNPGNYKSLFVSRYYANAVIGNKEEDMFYLRNGTGVRNMTLEGLSGDLTPANAYGTSRVTAGAYASLDPGWGPDDFRTWIIARSPYVQNCCTFGYAAIGQKIDGALHAGGNDSIVSNDFTQLISDGIGAWVTNNGRAELVSVFTYYSHIGYLAENGGRIRGTNGNNSYGDFGSVAEGVDALETPNTAVINNKAFKATVDVVNTDSDIMYNFEFANAGSEYTEVEWLTVGPGNFGDVEADEFRDDAVFQVRLTDLVDDSTNAPEAEGNFGGFGYLTNANTAQAGGASSLTLATTDPEISTAYIGMKVTITGGSGVGKYGIISAYDSGTKIATIVKESTGTSGWDHTILGYSNSNPDASSTYVIEPRITFSAPSFATSATTLPTSGNWRAVKYGGTTATYTAISGSSTTSVGGSGATFTVIRNTSKYYVSIVAGGTGYERLETITISGANLGGATTTNDIVITITSVNSANGAIQAIDFDGYGVGGVYVALRSGSQVGATSVDGNDWTTRATLMPSSASWNSIASGILVDGSSTQTASYFVAVAGGSANTTGAYSTDGITWTATTMVTSATWAGVAFGEQRFVAIASDSTVVRISLDGINWDVTGTLTTTGFTSIAYGMGLFVAVKSGTDVTNYSTDGVTWTAGTLPSSSDWNSVTWGNGRFVAISNTNGTVAAYSLDGITWTASTLPATADWTTIAYGQGVFLAVSETTQAATSEDGIVWTSRTMSTAASGFSAVTFGNPNRYGRFVAVGGSSGDVASYVRFGARARARAYVADDKIYAIRITEPGSGYASAPTMTITDPNNTYEAPFTVRIGKGALATPSFKNRGTGYTTSSAEIDTGDGYADYFQNGSYVAVKQITARPVAGSNVVFENLPGTYKLVSIVTFLGEYDGDYTAFYQVSPTITISQAPADGDSVTTRIRYSQVRLTGHDFLNIGFGNFANSNYPNDPLTGYGLIQANENVENNGGRVFFTSTDQDGNFRVGDLFTIEQSTGVATLNADAFNIAGLQELSLGEVTLGGGSATVTEFSTDPFFTADSDTVIPTQRAIKAYIASQIGGGGASLIVNSVTAGTIVISTNQITTLTNEVIEMNATFDFRGPVTGIPLAFNYFLT